MPTRGYTYASVTKAFVNEIRNRGGSYRNCNDS
jgi:hypothetical protein